jgi:phosphatidyl-myo-inositol alpha-mannosyltransferase
VLILAPAGRPADQPGVRIVGRALRIPYQGTVAPIAPSPASAGAVGRAMAAFRPSIVHVHEPLTPSTSMWATLRARAPVVATFHAYAERSRLYDLSAHFLVPVWRRLAVRLAVSEAARSFVQDRFGGEVRIVPNGVDFAMFRDARPARELPGGRRVVWVGRLDRQKGFPTVVDAFSLVAPETEDLHLVVVGDGRDRHAVERLASDLRRRVHMAGPVEHARLPSYLAGADAFITTPTGQESFGLVLVEAMAAGVPVVATDIPGYREILRDENEGFLVPPGDAEAAAKALRRILDDPALADRLVAAGRARAEGYSWDVLGARLEDVYEEVLKRR